jgi:HEPN domain-containing protein
MQDKAQAQLMLRKAAEDRMAIAFDLPDSIFGFHAQQAIEKLLKALIASRGDAYPRTHDLRQLLTYLQRSWGDASCPDLAGK